MKTYVHIVEDKVFESLTTEFNISDIFPPSMIWVEVTDLATKPEQDWTYDGVNFAAPIVPESTVQTKEQVEELRLTAYANPITGCDRYFAEVMSLQAEGFAASSVEVKDTKAKGLARKAEIQALYPWPTE